MATVYKHPDEKKLIDYKGTQTITEHLRKSQTVTESFRKVQKLSLNRVLLRKSESISETLRKSQEAK